MTELTRVQRLWSRWASIYDLRARLFMRRREAAVNAPRPRPGDMVLDLACGTGLNFPRIIERIGPQGRTVGLDCTRAMLEQARGKVARHRWLGVGLVQGDAASLGPVDARQRRWDVSDYGSLRWRLLPEQEGRCTTR